MASTQSVNYPEEMIKKYDSNAKLYSSIPHDQYLCPNCDRIPEIMCIHSDNGIVELKCDKHGDIIMKVEDYLNKMKDANSYFKIRCSVCNRLQYDYKDAQIFQYCYKCKAHFCGEHAQKHKKKPTSHNEMIPVTEKDRRCLEHFDEGHFTEYCLDCKENICTNINNKKHRNHNIKFRFEILLDKKKIAEKNKVLLNIIKLNDIILDTYERCPDNFLHARNVMNLADSIEMEKLRDHTNDNDKMKDLEIDIEENMKNIEEINKELQAFNVKIDRYQKDLTLKNLNLNDELLKKISKVKFNNLINMDISGNILTDLTCLLNMDLSKIKKFDASNNMVTNIKFLEFLNLENVEEIHLEKNKIEDVKVFISKTLPKIKKICLENNNIKNDLKEIKKLEVKYSGKLNIRSLNYKQFNEKYESNISENSSFINITNKPYGDIVIRELFLINDNYVKLKNLTLMSCEIIDISYLSKIRFANLEKLDLSFNKIEKIDVLADMRLDKLSDLFLHSNSIIDIYPLKFLKSKKLKTIGLIDNPILSGNYKKKNEEIIEYLKEKEIEVSLEEE